MSSLQSGLAGESVFSTEQGHTAEGWIVTLLLHSIIIIALLRAKGDVRGDGNLIGYCAKDSAEE